MTAPAAGADRAAERSFSLATLQPQDWIALCEALELSGVTRSMAAHSVLEAVSGEVLGLVLDEHNATLFNDEHRKGIEQALGRYFGASVQLHMRTGAVAGETPAAWRRRRDRERREAVQRCFNEDPLVQSLVQEFNARINPESIAPRQVQGG